jgi:hypothetical protein
VSGAVVTLEVLHLDHERQHEPDVPAGQGVVGGRPVGRPRVAGDDPDTSSSSQRGIEMATWLSAAGRGVGSLIAVAP